MRALRFIIYAQFGGACVINSSNIICIDNDHQTNAMTIPAKSNVFRIILNLMAKEKIEINKTNICLIQ